MNQYPQHPGHNPYPMQPPQAPQGKRPFRFQMWMLGLLIIPIGIGLSIFGAMKEHSVELGGSCSADSECKAGNCLSGTCATTCSPSGNSCPSGFSCQGVQVQLHNQGGFHDLGTQYYCMKGSADDSKSAAKAMK